MANKRQRKYGLGLALATMATLIICLPVTALAANPQNPQSNSVGLEGTVAGVPPTQGATITVPSSSQTLSAGPVTIAGLCPKGLLVKIFSNNVFIGSTICGSGSFSIQADLFNGSNDLLAKVYDALGQAGPDSNVPKIQFASAQFAQFGTQLSIVSDYAERGTDPGQQLTWPITVTGGTAPYALSVDWGDGSDAVLLSESAAGNVTLAHTYQTAGTYSLIIKGTDKNDETAFLQLVGVANGAVTASNLNGTAQTASEITQTSWWPAAVLLPSLFIAFWLGARHQLFTLRRKLERSSRDLD